MAALMRVARQGYRIFSASKPHISNKNILKPYVCFISTSKKNKDAALMPESIQSPSKIEEDLGAKEENWISHGYSLVDREDDEWAHHSLLFVLITICFVGGGYYLAYCPDMKMRDWTRREAYLELARREQEGLPLVDANLIDPAKVDLPSEEELADVEIII